MAEERLQKILARAGYGSRRSSEELIQARRVVVNGRVAELGDKADPQKDTILVDGRPVEAGEPLVYIALYKPRYVLSTVSTPDARQTVRDLVNVPERVYPVGRLDVDSEGLILLTNDGELANRLMHPRYGHEKEYRVLVARRPDEKQLEAWRRGVVLEDGYRTQPAEVRFESTFGKGAWLRVVLREGHKRQIRETGRMTGLPVVRIVRVRIGSLYLGNLKPGDWRYLTNEEVDELKGNAPAVQKGSLRSRSRQMGGSTRAARQRASSPESRRPGREARGSEARGSEAGRPAGGNPAGRNPAGRNPAGRNSGAKKQEGQSSGKRQRPGSSRSEQRTRPPRNLPRKDKRR
jgi:23S rRNA pseudouridine2605 synthase